MRYILIIVVGIIYMIWLIASIKDLINTLESYFFTHIWIELKTYSKVCAISHIIVLSCYSFVVFITGRT